jgi:uncharacterized protein (UPF0128 family)
MIRPIQSITRVMFILLVALLAAACGSTKVYDSSKTIVYNGSIYQVTDVKEISSKIEAVKADKSTVNMKNMSKDQVTDLINANKPLFVRMSFQMDDQELVYSATDVDSYRDYSRMLGKFEDAGQDIAKLMSAKKTEQLKLR